MRTLPSRLLALLAIGCARVPAPEADPPTPQEPASGPVVRVTASYPGANAQTVADTLAAPIEQQINGIEGATIFESESRNDGTYSLTIRFTPRTDVNAAQVAIQKRVALAEPALPEECRRVGVTVRKEGGHRFPPLWVSLTCNDNTYDALYLQNYATLKVKDDLARVPGVADVQLMSPAEYTLRVHADPDKLAARNLTVADVTAALRAQNVQVAAGQIGQPPASAPALTLKTAGRLTDLAQMESVIVKTTSDGKAIYLLRREGDLPAGRGKDRTRREVRRVRPRER